MHILESVNIGVKEIAAHKMRSILTMLGVIFGVAAVIATVAIGAGAEAEALREISLLGTNNIRIRKVDLEGVEKTRASKRSPYGLTAADIESLRNLLPDDIIATGAARRFEKTKGRPVSQVSLGGQTFSAAILGVTPEYAEAIAFNLAKGRFINRFDLEGQKQHVVIGYAVRHAFFPLDENRGIGQRLQIEGRDYTVVGVMERKAGSTTTTGLDVGDMNRYVMMPLTTGMGYFVPNPRREELEEIALKIDEGASLHEIDHVVRKSLARLHGGVEDFQTVIPENLLRQKQQVQRIFRYTLIAIAGISLLVGGIGIMNIMLSTVSQRTREIGVRRAIGATRRDVLSQFIIESLILSISGGLIGVGTGFLLARLIAYYTHWNTPISWPAVMVSFSVSALTGLIFGLYPAMKAAQLDPIEALRYE